MSRKNIFCIFVLAGTLASLATAQPLPSEVRQRERIRRYEEITAANPRDIESWHVLAGLYADAGEWDRAITAESRAIERHPKYAVAFHGRGKARLAKQDYAGAAEDFTSAIRLIEARGGLEIYLTLERPSEEYIDCYRSRGVSLAHLNRYHDGVADLSIALKLRPDDPKLLYERGYLEEKIGGKTDAIADYHRAGLIYADGNLRQRAEECLARLDSLGAKAEATAVRRKLEPRKPVSDLP